MLNHLYSANKQINSFKKSNHNIIINHQHKQPIKNYILSFITHHTATLSNIPQQSSLIIVKQMNFTRIFDAIKSSDNTTAKQLIENVIEKFEIVLDSENSSLLHIATNNVNEQLTEYLLIRYDKLIEQLPEKYSVEKKKKWINKKDNQGFTSLHYAVFRGNSKIAFLLEKHGADIYSINTQGLTVLHIAAQGDSPLLMFYYLNKGLKISVTDSKGSTALHWACYSGQQNACNALLSWGADIDCQDFTYGMTPLHLAVMSGNGRIVKKLLIKGCNRSIPNYSGKLALDIAQQNDYKNISQMIIDKRGVQQLLNIKNPFRKIGKRTFPFYIFLILFMVNFILNVSFVVTHHITIDTELSITFLVIGIVTIITFVIVSVSNPGNLKPQEPKNYFHMLMSHKPNKICFDCKIVKPLRSRHCQICDTCIKVYDHHCPWVGNCVGAKNYKYFFFFLIMIQLFVFYTIIYQIINLQKVDWKFMTQWLDWIRISAIIISLATSLLFLLPLTYNIYFIVWFRFLIFVQLKNLVLNKTTFQRYGFQQKSHNRRSRVSSMTSSSIRSSLLRQQQVENASFYTDKFSSPRKSRSGNSISYSEQSNNSYGANCYKMMCANSSMTMYQVTAGIM